MLKLLKFHCTLKSVSPSDECIGCEAAVQQFGFGGKYIEPYFFWGGGVVTVEAVNMFHVIHLDR